MNINIVKPFMPDPSEIADDFAKCLSCGLVTNNSPHVQMFEDKLQEFYGCPIKPSLNWNGELALYHLIQAWKHNLGVRPDESIEVLVPSFTFTRTINLLPTCLLLPVVGIMAAGIGMVVSYLAYAPLM